MSLRLLIVLALAATLASCAPQLSDQRDLKLEVGEIRTIVLEPVQRAQTIQVTAQSPERPISVYVYLSENDEEVDRKITLGKPSAWILASQEKSDRIVLEAKIPANKETMVRVASACPETANVHLEIAGR